MASRASRRARGLLLGTVKLREVSLTALPGLGDAVEVVLPGAGVAAASELTPCLASPQPQMSYPRAGSPTPSLIHMVELEFVGLLNN